MKVLMMGRFADIAGWSEREFADAPASISALIARVTDGCAELRAELDARSTLVARNWEIVRGDVPLDVGDEVAFMPPLSGG